MRGSDHEGSATRTIFRLTVSALAATLILAGLATPVLAGHVDSDDSDRDDDFHPVLDIDSHATAACRLTHLSTGGWYYFGSANGTVNNDANNNPILLEWDVFAAVSVPGNSDKKHKEGRDRGPYFHAVGLQRDSQKKEHKFDPGGRAYGHQRDAENDGFIVEVDADSSSFCPRSSSGPGVGAPVTLRRPLDTLMR